MGTYGQQSLTRLQCACAFSPRLISERYVSPHLLGRVDERMTRKAIFNLEFPDGCELLTVGGYSFKRVADYDKVLEAMQHKFEKVDEFMVHPKTGGHAVTAYVDMPNLNDRAIFNWGTSATAFSDVLMLLSLFTGRDVFGQDLDKFAPSMIVPYDLRKYEFGGIYLCSLNYKASGDDPFESYDIGFEEGLNTIYELIHGADWQREFKGGTYLKLAWMAAKLRTMESAFLSNWTIWEHLFCILNENWLSSEQIEKMSSLEKLSFLLVRFDFKTDLNKDAKQKLGSLSSMRNRLVHYGIFPERDAVVDEARFFIHLTESLVAKTLGLLPSNVFNTVEKFEKYFLPKQAGIPLVPRRDKLAL